MPTGEQRGFTYLWLLFAMAIAGASLSALGTSWQLAAQREREAELLFRGRQIATALASYRSHTPAGGPSLPNSLEELVEDRRSGVPLRHLRRLYTDPFTGQADWVLITAGEGSPRIVGVHSRSQQAALRTAGITLAAREGSRPVTVGDWRFGAPTSRTSRPPAAAASSVRGIDADVSRTDQWIQRPVIPSD